MSKNLENLPLENKIKFSYGSKPKRVTKTLLVTNLENSDLEKGNPKKDSERLTDYNQKNNSKNRSHLNTENLTKKTKPIQFEKVQNENININNQPISDDTDENIAHRNIVEINDKFIVEKETLLGKKID